MRQKYLKKEKENGSWWGELLIYINIYFKIALKSRTLLYRPRGSNKFFPSSI
jgi:hypothetical protein